MAEPYYNDLGTNRLGTFWNIPLQPVPGIITKHTLLLVGQEVLELCVHLLVDGAWSECLHSHIGARDGGTHDTRMETRVLPGNKNVRDICLC